MQWNPILRHPQFSKNWLVLTTQNWRLLWSLHACTQCFSSIFDETTVNQRVRVSPIWRNKCISCCCSMFSRKPSCTWNHQFLSLKHGDGSWSQWESVTQFRGNYRHQWTEKQAHLGTMVTTSRTTSATFFWGMPWSQEYQSLEGRYWSGNCPRQFPRSLNRAWWMSHKMWILNIT